jgi:hypothetical protein
MKLNEVKIIYKKFLESLSRKIELPDSSIKSKEEYKKQEEI